MRDIVDTLFHASVRCVHIWVSGHTLPTIWKGVQYELGEVNLGIYSGLEIWV